MTITPEEWYFISEARRDAYLCQAVARGRQVKRKTILNGRVLFRFIADCPKDCELDAVHVGRLFTVVDIDRRAGK